MRLWDDKRSPVYQVEASTSTMENYKEVPERAKDTITMPSDIPILSLCQKEIKSAC